MRATSFVVPFVVALKTLSIEAVTTKRVLHVGQTVRRTGGQTDARLDGWSVCICVIGHHVLRNQGFMFPRRGGNEDAAPNKGLRGLAPMGGV